MVKTIIIKNIFITLIADNTPQAISDVPIYTTDFEIYSVSTNGGNVYLLNAIDADANEWIPISAGDKKNYVHGTGNMGGSDPVLAFDLSRLYVSGRTAGDEIIIQYLAQG